MKHARFNYEGRIVEGVVKDDVIVSGEDGREYPISKIEDWLPPIVPNQMIGVAINFSDHASELGFDKPEAPVLFHKFNSTLTGHRTQVEYPEGTTYMHYENEVLVVIGRTGRRIKAEEAMDYVKGYTIGNDVTVRDFLTNFYRPPVKVKGYDTFGPMGPYFVDKEDIADVNNLNIRTWVNGELRQEGNTKGFIFTIPELIAYISDFMTLHENDVIWTGTPEGISKVFPGDVMRLEIEGLGVLENTVEMK